MTCPHCGTYCTNNSIFCTPPIKESNMEMMSKGQDKDFSIPEMVEFTKDSIEYVAIKKESMQKLASVITLEADMIQALASQCEMQMEVIEQALPNVNEGIKEKLTSVSELFSERYDKVFKHFLQAMQEIGLNIDTSLMFPPEDKVGEKGMPENDQGKAEETDQERVDRITEMNLDDMEEPKDYGSDPVMGGS